MRFEPDASDISMLFSRWSRLMKDWRPAFTDVVKLFRKHEKRHFKTKGRSTGTPWPTRYSPKYAAWKEKHFPGRPLLVLRGTRRESLIEKGAPGSLELSGQRSMAVGSDPNYVVPPTHLPGPRGGTKIRSIRLITYAKAQSRGKGVPARPPIRYDPAVYTKGLKQVGKAGKAVPLGVAIAQLFQVYIVKARKDAFKGDVGVWSDWSANWKKMRRGVMKLKTR